MTNLKTLKNTLLSLGKRTSDIALELRKKGLEKIRKPDGSLATNADLACESLILETLARSNPEIPVLSEESYANKIVPDFKEDFFCVDPIDGTHNYARGKMSFTINIALIHSGIPIAGMVAAPDYGKIYYGDHKQGACLYPLSMEQKGKEKTLRTRTPVHNQLQAVASLSHHPEELLNYLKQQGVSDIKPVGSSLKFCLIAEGKADIYARFNSIMEWDIAAGDAIVRAAGGQTTLLDGSPLYYGKNTPEFHTPAFVSRALPNKPYPL